eukprot:1193446-Prorocentrum_minimum.AAC.1
MATLGRLAAISTLLEYCQAKPDRETSSGYTALMAAAANGQVCVYMCCYVVIYLCASVLARTSRELGSDTDI